MFYDQNICISRTWCVFGHASIWESFIYWLLRYEPAFLGWASCSMLPWSLSMGIQVITFIIKFGMKIRLCRWGLGMDKLCHPTLCNGYKVNYVSMLGLKLTHVNRRSPGQRTICVRSRINNDVRTSRLIRSRIQHTLTVFIRTSQAKFKMKIATSRGVIPVAHDRTMLGLINIIASHR